MNVKRSLVDLNTRDITGSDYSKNFNIGALSATSRLPRISDAYVLASVPVSIRGDQDWRQGFGDGVAYGVSGSSNLVDVDMSLGQVASYFGIPLTYNKSAWGGALRASCSLIDATLGIEAGIDYDASVALKPNVYAIVEGGARRHDILPTTCCPTTNS